MKFLKLLSFFVTAGLIFGSCQKELTFAENAAKGSLKYNVTGDCMPVTVNGIYEKDITLAASNYIDIQVNITTTGTYDIRTDTVNGYSFRSTGETAVTGLNTIRLKGTGKPLIGPSTDVFRVKFDTSDCEINVSVITGGGGVAIYTFGATGANCTGAVLGTGTYVSGLSANGNTVTLNVTVTQAGTYSISTPSINNVIYSGSGTFTTAGTTVILTAAGTPAVSATPVTSSYQAQTGTGMGDCSFSVTYAASPAPASYTVNCGAVTVSGTYQISTATTAANFVTIPVVAAGPGLYSITTGTQNGITFSGSGNFTAAGPQNIVLRPVAGSTPTGTAGTATYSFTATGNPSCSFPVTYAAATGPAGGTIACKIDGTPNSFNIDAGATVTTGTFPSIDISGTQVPGDDPSIQFGFLQNGGAISSGTYTVNQLAAGIILQGLYRDAAHVEYEAQTNGSIQTPPFTIVISTITATRVTGTFFGPLKDNGGAGPGVRQITEGTFDVPRF